MKNNKTNFIFFDKPNFKFLIRKLLLRKNKNVEIGKKKKRKKFYNNGNNLNKVLIITY